MIIQALTTFKHDVHTYSEGKGYEVDPEDGIWFCQNGWAKRVDGGEQPAVKPAPKEVVLSPQDVNQVVDFSISE